MATFGATAATLAEGTFTGADDFYFVGAYFPGGTITAFEAYIGDRAGNAAFNNFDYALYTGGSSDGPSGAALVWSSKHYSGVGVGEPGWKSIVDASDAPPNVSVPAGWLWFVLRSGDGVQQYCCSGTDRGDLAEFGDTRSYSGTGDAPGGAWPATFAANGAPYFACMAVRVEYTPAGGGGEISGSSALAISGTGTLTGSGTLAGAAGLAFAASAALNGAGALAGSGTLAFSTGAALKGAGALSGTTDLAFAASAALKGAGALAGSTASAFSASAALRGSGALSGAAVLAFGASGSMAQGAISGSSQNIFSALGTLIGDGALSAAGGFAFVPTGTLSATVSISGSSALGFSVSGTLLDVGAIHTPRSRTRVVHKVERHALIVKTDRSALVKRRGRLH